MFNLYAAIIAFWSLQQQEKLLPILGEEVSKDNSSAVKVKKGFHFVLSNLKGFS